MNTFKLTAAIKTRSTLSFVAKTQTLTFRQRMQLAKANKLINSRFQIPNPAK